MKNILLLSTLLLFGFTGFGQLFKITNGPVVKDAQGETLELAFVGGLNQPQFSNIDLNNDGDLDLIVFDRSGKRNLTFLASKLKGTLEYRYEPKYEEFLPKVEQFLISRDFNNNGKMDLWFYEGDYVHIYQNTTEAGATYPSFSKISELKGLDKVQPVVFNPFKRLTPLNNSLPGIEDLDGDGDIDFVGMLNFVGSNMQLLDNTTADSNKSAEDITFSILDKCYGGVAEDDDVYLNAPCDFYEAYKRKKHFASKTLLFFDNDNDGDMDLFLGNSERLETPIYFLENGKADLNYYKDTFIVMNRNFFSSQVTADLPTAPGMFSVDINLDGELDLVISANEADKSSYPIHEKDNVFYFLNKGTTSAPVFDYQQKDFLVGDMIDFGSRTAPAFGDLDGDGDLDMLVATNGDHYDNGDTADVIARYENVGTASNPIFQLRDENFLDIRSESYQGLVPALEDLDSDGDLDLFLGNATGSIYYYLNSGSKSVADFMFQTNEFAGIKANFNSAPYFYDLDEDGLVDLLLGSSEGTVRYYKNKGTASIPSLELEDDSLGGILVNETFIQTVLDEDFNPVEVTVVAYEGFSVPTILKWDNGVTSIAVGGDEGIVRLYDIAKDLQADFPENKDYMQTEITKTNYNQDWGTRVYPAGADLNGDGVSDIVLGNTRGGLNFIEGIPGVKKDIGSVRQFNRQSFNVYPNPTRGSLVIFVNSTKEFTYELFSLTGQLVQSGSTTSGVQIDVNENVANGAYIISLKEEDVFYAPQRVILAR